MLSECVAILSALAGLQQPCSVLSAHLVVPGFLCIVLSSSFICQFHCTSHGISIHRVTRSPVSHNKHLICFVGTLQLPNLQYIIIEPHFHSPWLFYVLSQRLQLLLPISLPVVFSFISHSNEDLKAPGLPRVTPEQWAQEEADWAWHKSQDSEGCWEKTQQSDVTSE